MFTLPHLNTRRVGRILESYVSPRHSRGGLSTSVCSIFLKILYMYITQKDDCLESLRHDFSKTFPRIFSYLFNYSLFYKFLFGCPGATKS